jgi:hypothetical protein
MGACTTKCAIFCVDKYSNCIDYMNNEGQYNETPPTEIKINLPPNIQHMIRKPYSPPDVQQKMVREPIEQVEHPPVQQIVKEPVQPSAQQQIVREQVDKKDYTDKSNGIKKVSSYNNLDEDFEIIN